MNRQDSRSRQIAACFFSVLNSQYRTIHAEDETPLFRDYFGEEKRNAFFDLKKYDHIDRGKTERKVFFGKTECLYSVGKHDAVEKEDRGLIWPNIIARLGAVFRSHPKSGPSSIHITSRLRPCRYKNLYETRGRSGSVDRWSVCNLLKETSRL